MEALLEDIGPGLDAPAALTFVANAARDAGAVAEAAALQARAAAASPRHPGYALALAHLLELPQDLGGAVRAALDWCRAVAQFGEGSYSWLPLQARGLKGFLAGSCGWLESWAFARFQAASLGGAVSRINHLRSDKCAAREPFAPAPGMPPSTPWPPNAPVLASLQEAIDALTPLPPLPTERLAGRAWLDAQPWEPPQQQQPAAPSARAPPGPSHLAAEPSRGAEPGPPDSKARPPAAPAAPGPPAAAGAAGVAAAAGGAEASRAVGRLDALALLFTAVKNLCAGGALAAAAGLAAALGPAAEAAVAEDGRPLHETLIRNEAAYFNCIRQLLLEHPPPPLGHPSAAPAVTGACAPAAAAPRPEEQREAAVTVAGAPPPLFLLGDSHCLSGDSRLARFGVSQYVRHHAGCRASPTG
jgi:hypothetical protein